MTKVAAGLRMSAILCYHAICYLASSWLAGPWKPNQNKEHASGRSETLPDSSQGAT